MNKVFLDTYWVMAGKERGAKPPIVSRSWLTSVLPPFYKGYGIAIRIGSYSLRFGVCSPRMPVTVDEYAYVDDMQENLDALVGFEMDETNREIRKWESSNEPPAQPEMTSTSTSSDERSPGSDAETSPTSSKDT